jgi:hypothetical protein
MATNYPNPLSRSYLQGVLDQRPTADAIRKNYIGANLLPFENVTEWDLTWDVVQAENNLAGIFAINGIPVPGSDMMFSQAFATVQSIMATRIVDPVAVFNFRDPGTVNINSTPDRIAYDRATRAVRRALVQCDDEVDGTLEYMRMQAMQGQIVWPPKDADGNAISVKMPQWGAADFVMTYPFRTVFKQKATTLAGYGTRVGGRVAWSSASATIMRDLETIRELIQMTTGLPAVGSTLLCSSSLLSYLAFNTEVIDRMKYNDQGLGYISIPALKNYLTTAFGYNIVEYDAQWTYRSSVDSPSGPTVSMVPFLPRTRALILPPNVKFGSFAVAPTPAPENTYVNGKMVWKYSNPKPGFQTELGVTITGFPMITESQSIFVFDWDS